MKYQKKTSTLKIFYDSVYFWALTIGVYWVLLRGAYSGVAMCIKVLGLLPD